MTLRVAEFQFSFWCETMHLRFFYFPKVRNILVFYFLVYNFVDGYWSKSEGMGEGAEFGAVIDDLLKQGPEMLREKTESDENSDSSAGKPESVIGGLSGGVGGNSAIICPSGKRNRNNRNYLDNNQIYKLNAFDIVEIV